MRRAYGAGKYLLRAIIVKAYVKLPRVWYFNIQIRQIICKPIIVKEEPVLRVANIPKNQCRARYPRPKHRILVLRQRYGGKYPDNQHHHQKLY